MAKDTPYLDVQQLTKSFGSLVLFRDISFSIAEGQKVGLIAKNGFFAELVERQRLDAPAEAK